MSEGGRIDIDTRFLAVALLLMCAGAWIDAAEAWIDRAPNVTGPVYVEWASHMARTLRADEEQREAAVTHIVPVVPHSDVVPAGLGEGPRHQPDDARTGIGYYAWYRASLPDDPFAVRSFQAVADDPNDVDARWNVARVSYDWDDYDAAVWHYRWLRNSSPDDPELAWRLSLAERRRGHHAAEIALCRSILAQDPTDARAMGGLAVALARMGRLDEASHVLDDLQIAAPMAPETDMATALIAAAQGKVDDALEGVGDALNAQGQLTAEGRVELRRDIAIDPLLAPLRGDRRLLALMYRTYGTAAPRAVR